MPLPPLPVDLACPPPTADPAVHVEVVTTAYVHDDWKRVVDDGTTGPVAMAVMVGIVRTPDTTLLIDAGLGRSSAAGEYPGFPITALSELEVVAPIADQLDAPPDLVLLTHPHYDHVGGLFDLPDVPVWITEADWRAYGKTTVGFPKRLKRAVDWRPVALRAGQASQVLGRPAVDVLGDGRIWYLSLPGHTPGAAAVLVRAEDGPWLFIGDTAWVDKHLEGARRPWLTRTLLDADVHEVAESLEWARWLKAECPDLRVIAGHEPTLAGGLASSPQE
ncbi:MAG: MBL fold metallo-hydrolase [Alphaproteobacteria bacterium]|nr:MBL fold metallo-hydrolase [Alphaproteobacteria bacterium]